MNDVKYRPDVQGLRALAVLSVILFHFNPKWMPGGFIGVDIFFVISGYLISSILLHKKSQPSYRFTDALQYFYSSRLKRIAPAYFAMLLTVSLIAAVLLLPPDLEIYKNSLKEALWFHSNTYFAEFSDYFAPANYEQPLMHTWSLAIEIQFYLLIPLVILLLPLRFFKRMLIFLLLGLTIFTQYRLNIREVEQATYFSLSARLPEFFVGSLIAIYAKSSSFSFKGAWCSSLGLVLVLLAAAIQPILGSFPGFSALLPVTGSALILWKPAEGFTRTIMTNRPMVWLGEISYSLYLWHWPILAFLRYYSGEEVLDFSFSLLFAALTFVLASLSFYLIENPFKVSAGKNQIFICGFLIAVVVGVSKNISDINTMFSPIKLPIEYLRYADPSQICHGQVVGNCLKGDLGSKREILILGDSHAAMLNIAFDELGKDLGFKARIITASSCVTTPEFDYQRIPVASQKACINQIMEAQKYLKSANIIVVAAMWNWHLKSQLFQDSLQNLIRSQNIDNKKIYLIAQEPLLASNPLRALRFKNLSLPSEIYIDADYKKYNSLLTDIAKEFQNVQILNFEDKSFFSQAPFYQGQLIYFDTHHLNEVGSSQYGKVLRTSFEELRR